MRVRDVSNIGAALEQLEIGLRLIADTKFMESIGEDAQNMVRAGVIQHMRNITSHTYRRETADEVLLEAPALASEARSFMGRLSVLGADDSA